MAVANSTEGIWVNNDGLRVKMTVRAEAALGTAGEFQQGVGSDHISEFEVTFSQVAQGTSQTLPYILDYDTIIPSTAVIDRVEWITGTPWATDTSLDFGFVTRGTTSTSFTTILDADGLLVAFLLANRDAAGETTMVTPAGTFAGALMGVQAGIGQDAVVCASWNGAAPTAGTGKLRIHWRDASSNA